MTCGGCENAVKRAVGQLPGVAAVNASHQQQRVEVDFDPEKIDLGSIRQKIEKLGYRVEQG